MRPNKLRELLKANEPTLSTHIHTTWPSVVEAIGHTGLYDYVEFVGEYGPFDLHDLDNLARAGDIYNMSMQLKVDQEPRGFLAQRAIGSVLSSRPVVMTTRPARDAGAAPWSLAASPCSCSPRARSRSRSSCGASGPTSWPSRQRTRSPSSAST